MAFSSPSICEVNLTNNIGKNKTSKPINAGSDQNMILFLRGIWIVLIPGLSDGLPEVSLGNLSTRSAPQWPQTVTSFSYLQLHFGHRIMTFPHRYKYKFPLAIKTKR